MSHAISKEFTFPQLLRFAFPSIIMMIFMSMYTIVDGFFVSRFVGPDALSALNIVWPLVSAIIAIGVMFASGGSAIVARQMGEGRPEEANRSFSLIIWSAVLLGTVTAALCLIFREPVLKFLGAEGVLIPLSLDYMVILLLFAPLSVLQLLFQSFFVTAGHPKLGLTLTMAGGLTNMVLDYVFIVPMDMGIRGAALATALGYCSTAIGGLIFFTLNRHGLCLCRPSRSLSLIWDSCVNGSSEMVTNLSGSVTTLLFNLVMLHFAGSDGVAAITAVLYSQFLLNSLYMGFSMGISPVISYHWGANNIPFLRRTLRHSIVFIVGTSVAVFAASFLVADPICALFFPDALSVRELAAHGFRLFAISLLFAGINIFGSAFYTALGNGRTSAAISFTRTFLFTVAGILGMSWLLGMDGLWLAIPVAEAATALFVAWLSRSLRDDYGLL